MHNSAKAWPALWSLVIGFFMILVDSTIVSVAIPAIMKGLNADIGQVIWVNSSYLLAVAVPLLITGRLGDRFGPKKIYLIGLAVFTIASAWCGLSSSVEMLIVARIVQGLGASMLTPQTMAVITRLFAPQDRGGAMGLWGATAGVATLVGPLLGGVLIDSFGWEWIFMINVPVGIVGFILAMVNVPAFEVHSHSFDWLGVALSGIGMFLLVFGIEEGQTYNWGTIVGPISVWSMIIAGIVFLAAFVAWQAANKREPLLPLSLFKDRNFSLANTAMTAMGFTITAQILPIMLYFQNVLKLTPTESALMLVPSAVISGALAPSVGKAVARSNPKYFAAPGFLIVAVAIGWFAILAKPDTQIWQLLLASGLLGFGMAGIWSSMSISATRNLSPRQAGAGSGVFNTLRQIGAVLGSAAIAAMMQARIQDNLSSVHPAGKTGGAPVAVDPGAAGSLPEPFLAPFATAMGQSLWLPAAVVLVGFVCAIFLAKPKPVVGWGQSSAPAAPGAEVSEAPTGDSSASTAAATEASHRAASER